MTDLVQNADEVRPGSFTVLGRTITVAPMNTLSEGQALGFMKIFQRYMYGEVNGPAMVKLDQALSKLLDPDDNAWLDYQIMEGNIQWAELLTQILPCLRRGDEPKPEKVKAARARKAPAKKAPAKRARKSA